MSDITLGRGPNKTSSMINLGRSNRYFTTMGWRPIDPNQGVRLTADLSAVVCGPDLKSLPTGDGEDADAGKGKKASALRKGVMYLLQLDCTVAPRGNWVTVTPHADLLAICDVQACTPMIEPHSEPLRVTLMITPRGNMQLSDVPVNCAYLHQFS